jgi:hypothetical protein
MADEKLQKINVGFLGGPVLSARVAPAEVTRLRGALGSQGWHDLVAEDATVALALDKIVYLLVDHEGHRVGFGS